MFAQCAAQKRDVFPEIHRSLYRRHHVEMIGERGVLIILGRHSKEVIERAGDSSCTTHSAVSATGLAGLPPRSALAGDHAGYGEKATHQLGRREALSEEEPGEENAEERH